MGGPGCEQGKSQGFFSKNAQLKLWRWIWATGSKSSVQDLMRVGVLGLTGMGRSDQSRGAIWAAGWGIDGPDLARAATAVGCGRRGRQSGGAAPASGGARASRRWGAPLAAGPPPKRRARACELNRNIPWRRRRRAAAHDGQRRWRRSGEDEPTAWSTNIQTNGTGGLLTSRRFL
jgi:hypothetical protein